MRLITIFVTCLILFLGMAYLILPTTSLGDTESEKSEAQKYTCGMHPQIMSDEPGICPICNMKLTPIRNSGGSEGSVRIDGTTKQNMGLVTTTAEYHSLARPIYAFGEVTVPELNDYNVTVKFGGWIERLFVSEEGEQVFKGQPLLEVYSPDLVSAQKELLVALKSGKNESMMRMAEAARSRLRNWDISDDQLQQLEQSGEVTRALTIRSPADGFVKAKHISEGDRVAAKSVLFEISNLSNVWITAQIYEQDLPFVKLHQKAKATLPGLPGRSFEGSISYISPALDKKGQVEVRLELDNDDFALKPAMYAEVMIESKSTGEQLAIPRGAVINSGIRRLVYVATGDDEFEPRSIVTGTVGENDLIEVVEGLKQGDAVVTSGQFLLDSESRLNEKSAMPAGHDHGSMMHQASAKMDEPQKKSEKSEDPYDIHTCPTPSHYNVLNYGPGTCDECGMKLVPVSKTDNAPVYVCPMPSCKTVTQEPGSCPVCNMNLVVYHSKDTTAARMSMDSSAMRHQHGKMKKQDVDTAQTKMTDDPYNIHTCPMPSHFHVLNYGPGICDECNMKLVPVSKTENVPVYVCPMPSCKTVTQEPGLCPVCNMHLKEYKPEKHSDK